MNWRNALVVVFTICLLMPYAAWARDAKVLILHSYHAGFAWTDDQQQGFLEALKGSDVVGQVALRVEYLDASPGGDQADLQESFYTYLKTKYTRFIPDLIYATDDEAVAFLERYRRRLFPSTPVVYSGLDDLALDKRLDQQAFQGVFELKDVAGSIALAMHLEPTLRTLFFIGDDSAAAQGIKGRVEKEAAKVSPDIEVVFYNSASVEAIEAFLGNMQPKLLVVSSLEGVYDAQGNRVALHDTLQRLNDVGRFKILAMKDIYLTSGALGGAVNRGREQGGQAGYLAREQVFNETNADNESLYEVVSTSYMFDYRQMQRFGLASVDLPPGSTIVGRPPSFWMRHRLLITVLSGMAGLQLLAGWFLWRLSGTRRGTQKYLHEKEAQFKTVIRATHDAVVVINERGLVTLFNPAAEELFGWSSAEMLGCNLDILMPEGYRDQHRHDVASFFSTGEPSEAVGRSLELLAVHRSGKEFPIELSLSVGKYGHERFVLAILRDISSQRQVEREIKQLAYYDSLTGLPNRALFEDRFRRVLTTADRAGKMAALLFIGVDNLNSINDTHGHTYGDKLLKVIGQRLVAVAQNGATVVRWEGDKFVVLLPGLSDAETADTVARQILQSIAEPCEVDDQSFFVTASIGGAVYPQHGADGDKLLKNADMAMYASKELGRNTYCTFTEEMNRRVLERSGLEHNLRLALAREEFFLAYQPQVDQATGKVLGSEALLRWRHAEKGMISPGQFIPLAEESGLILPIGHWVLQTACAQNKAWQLAGYPPMRIAVNLSARQFQQPDFFDQVAQVLKDTELDPRYLELELTESLLMADADVAVETLRALRDLGVGIAIDDFGTGYSSLSYLKTFPIDRIKIAQEFVLDITRDPGDAAIVETVIAMAHGLGLDIVAEGVETEAQLEFLRARRCQVMQGYYFGRPMPAENFIEYLSENLVSVFPEVARGA
ncbi:sensor diguanylate cyclase/phosphodiesterase, PAS domain-containing [Syntrophotalea carbinolica DSM 2380]|uniref:Sensor diguanylate cyclase/phosphodiesterase, PAS domain-containing n=1 Tax=Syntrophotalea carbinolica (strain DSM 2380 / NBRC 103641 / GraBd1) TaxID=338963 RepID=Q3A6S1_SYNC1|nr:EAL domain-containing protein [Syntrophotalea carbinolica]ABA87936.1 sensor diguanylate cyclase/phosphodiesterase, PAS domain-containing [Syntrophotalea carbinolica DSM 2380]